MQNKNKKFSFYKFAVLLDPMNLVLDIGNSRVKLALFKNNKCVDYHVIEKSALERVLRVLIKKHTITHGICSATGSLSEAQQSFLAKAVKLITVSSELKLPFKNKYKTPSTLGSDRIAVMTAAAVKYPGQDVLVVDAGTCITYDYLSNRGYYLGGAISPGITMRYTALNAQTANLPLLNKENIDVTIGATTNEALHAGVLNGVVYEIDGVIDQYKNTRPDLTIILTGGDAFFLANRLKNTIFATSNFLLEGLNFLLEINVSK